LIFLKISIRNEYLKLVICASFCFVSKRFKIIFFLLATLLGLFAAEFPDDAALARFAIIAGVGAGLALVQAFLAIVVLHLVAAIRGLPPRVKAAFHNFLFHSLTI